MIDTTHIERNILGGLILWPERYHDISQVAYPFMFSEKMRPLADYLFSRISEGEAVEIGAVITDAQAQNLATGRDILEMTESPALDDLPLHCSKLRQAYLIRQDSNRYNNALKALMSGEAHEKVRARFDAELESLQSMIEVKADRRNADILEAYDHLVKGLGNDGLNGVPTGFRQLNEHTGGWQGGNYILIGARPGMGKTTIALDFAYAAALAGSPGAVFSLEMTSRELYYKLAAKRAGVSPHKIVRSEVDEEELVKIWAGLEYVSELPLYVYDDTSIDNTLQAIRDKARQVQREHGLEWLVVDYLQLMRAEGQSKNEKIESISQGFKRMAKQMNIPVIVLSQLSRAVETRGGTKEPMLSDLRDSGSLEQDADMIIFPYRPEYYNIEEDEEGNSLLGCLEVIVAKHRMGGLTRFRFHYNAARDSYLDIFQEPFSPAHRGPTAPTAIPASSRPGADEEIPF